MYRFGLLIIAIWPAISIAQNSLSLKDSERAQFQANELFFKRKYLQSVQKWESIAARPESAIDKNQEYLSWFSRQVLLREHSNEALEEFFLGEPTHPKRSFSFFLMGLEAFRQKNYSSTVKYFQAVSSAELSTEDRGEYFFKSGYALMMEKQIEPAIQEFNKVKGQSSGYGPPAAYYSAYLQFESGNYAQAKKDLALVGSGDAFSGSVNDLLAVIYYKEGNADALIQFAEELKSSGKKQGHIKNLDLLVGDAYFQRSNYVKAWSYFSKIKIRNTGTMEPELAYRFGRTLFENQNYEEAEKYLKVGASKSKNDTLTQFCAYFAGVNYSKLEDFPSAALFFDKAAAVGPHRGLRENASINRAKIRIKEGFTSQAISLLKDYLVEYPGGAYKEEASSLLAEAYLNSNQYYDGIHHLEKNQNWSYVNKSAYQQLCFHYASEKFNDRAFDSAVHYFVKSNRYSVDKDLAIRSNFWVGESYSISGKWDKSILYYGRVFQLDPNGKSKEYYPSRYGIGYAYFKIKDYDKAKGHFRAYANKYESQGGKYYEDALLRLGDAYFVSRDYANAFKVYEKIYNRGLKGRDYAIFRLGEISWIENDSKAAVGFFSKISVQYPKSPYLDDAMYEGATVSFESGDYVTAIAGFQGLIRKFPLSPYVPESIRKRGMAYVGRENNVKAIGDFREYLRRYPRSEKSEEVLSSLNEALIAEGREGEFQKDKVAFQKANPDSKALERIEFENGKELHLAGEYERSIPLLLKFLDDYPGSAYSLEATYYLAFDYDRTGDPDSAFNFYLDLIAFGNSEYLKTAFERSSKIAVEAEKYEKAIIGFEGWYGLATSDEERVLATEGLMRSYYEIENYDSSLAKAQSIADFESPFGNRNLALLYWAKSLEALGRLDDAKARYQITVNEASDENAAEAKFRIASIQYQLAEFRNSIETCLDLVSGFSQYAYWNDQAFLLVADNFLGLNDLFQARATLESIIENSPSEETVSRAREKLALVSEKEMILETMTDTLITDTIE